MSQGFKQQERRQSDVPRATQPALPAGRQQSEKHLLWEPRALGLRLGSTVESLGGL